MSVGLVHRVDLYRDSATGVEDEWGVPGETVARVASAVPALVQPRASREQPVPSGVEISDALIFVPFGTDLRAGDLVVLGSASYRVVGIPLDAGGAGHHLEASGRRVSLGG